jgi:hypothetical protein
MSEPDRVGGDIGVNSGTVDRARLANDDTCEDERKDR